MEEGNKMHNYDDFINRIEIAKNSEGLDRSVFIGLSKSAVLAEQENPEERQKIANLMSDLWIDSGQKLGDEVVDKLGHIFTELEVPDDLVQLDKTFRNVQDKWSSILEIIEK